MNALAGTVTEILPSGLYRVRLDEGPGVVAHSVRGIDGANGSGAEGHGAAGKVSVPLSATS